MPRKGEAAKKAIRDLTPGVVKIKLDDVELAIPSNSKENAIVNAIMAAQGRALIQQSIRSWKDAGVNPTPKELRDIAGAMRDIADLSTAVTDAMTKTTDSPTQTAKLVTQIDANPDAIDFSSLNIATNGKKTPEADPAGPDPVVAGEDSAEDKTGDAPP